ncbi:serine/threonine protein kinase [Candidatus Chloroploca sp. M-50]|uniref:non-specific serine/threonine protein kinase n=1 Tax=Candidatus Chloroploca mongolica TaxID=2528176 RepID=A0ABS4D4V7_9CHLR|nr:serine/threonine-protein kinase [Candidatus Chloroploca mongolica]MBP1464471.1 serine/threonine protein kinase [Candidatus Chloroploca mongolica]
MTGHIQWNPGVLVGNERYRIEAELGSGGAGMVFRATQLELDDQVALKVATAVDPAALEALREEARLLRRLRHPHLPLVSDFFVEGGCPCLVMEYIEGQDLHTFQSDHGGIISEAEALTVMEDVAEALAYLHAQSPPIIHRDIKPANIRVRPDGTAVLVDFGIAKIGGAGTQTHMMGRGIGTPPYAPPEQYASGLTDTYTDVYAFGATLYVLLTGELPVESVLRLSGQTLVPPRQINPALSASTEQVILKAMAVVSGVRFGSGRELLEALRSDQPLQPSVPPTTKLRDPQICPICGAQQQTVNPLFCIQCGVPLALRFPQTNRILADPTNLIAYADAEWDAATGHLLSQRLRRWLETLEEYDWLERLQQAVERYPQDHDAALELLLRPTPLEDLRTDQPQINFGRQMPGSRPTAGLQVRIATPSYLHGEVQSEGDWFTVTPTKLRVYPGHAIPPILIAVKPEALEAYEAERSLTGGLTLTTNRGKIELPVTMIVYNPPRPQAPTLVNCGRVESRQRSEQRVVLRNIGGGVYGGQVSARQAWLLVESQQARFALHRGEQHTVNFSVETHMLTPTGVHEGHLLWESEEGDLLTRVQIEVVPPLEVHPGEPATAIIRPEDLIVLCDCVRGSPPHAWERGISLLQSGKLAHALRFFHREELAREAEMLLQQNDHAIALEQMLRKLGAKPARHFKDNQGKVIGQITGPLSRKPPVIEYIIRNTSKRGYLYGSLRPLVEWLSIPDPGFGCLPDHEAIVTCLPDYNRRTRAPLFGTMDLFEVVLE